MRYLALASDYDGTLAHDGVVDDTTIRALERLKHSGRRLILVTGRELRDLELVFPQLELCDRVVAENGALLYNPGTREKKMLATGPPTSFVDDLRHRGISNLSTGDVIVATWCPHEQQAIEAIRESGLELQIIFNKDAVMILPSGVNKSTGLCAALEDLKLSTHNLIGIGDAENDHAFLESCECAVAVANAIPALKERADVVTEGARGGGVTEIIEHVLRNDLSDLVLKTDRDQILVGKTEDGSRISIPAYGRNILVCGHSGSGKSTAVSGLLERIMERKYQVCLIDPEGDYENLPNCRTVGDEKRPPAVEHVKQVLEAPEAQVIVNLVAVSPAERPHQFAALTSDIQHLRLQTGRPHWLVIDEAHHVLPSEWAPVSTEMSEELNNLMLITVRPEHVSAAALKRINTLLVLGKEPGTTLAAFAQTAEMSIPDVQSSDLSRSESLLCWLDKKQAMKIQLEPPKYELHRHRRKYAEGRLEPERMFHFRGPADKLNLPAQNLNVFIQLAEGIDEETWRFHLSRGDYSNWLRHGIKDSSLADEVAGVERDSSLPDQESRDRIRNAILQRYTAPA